MKTLKRIISILVIFALFASLTAVNVGAVSTPASLMGKYINFGTFDADGDGTADPMVYLVAGRDDVNADGIGDYYLLSANSLMNAGVARTNSTYRHYNRWSLSDMRVWLNSDAETGQVAFTNHIEGTTPDANYKDRAGFLNSFNSYETSLILPVTHKSVIGKWHKDWTDGAPDEVINITSGTDGWNWGGDVHSGTSAAYYGTHVSYEQGSELSKRWRHLDSYANIDGYTFDKGTEDTSDDDVRGEATKEETTDKVFIPSIIDCYKYKLPLHDLMGSGYAHTWLRDVANGRKDSDYWTHNATFTRDTTSKISSIAVAEQQQIRPAMFIDGAVDYQVTGDGTKANPYTLVESKSCDDLTGKYIYFGEYGPSAEEKYPIKWYIAGTKDVDADGTEEYYMIASEIISLKEFSAYTGDSSHQKWNSAQWVASALRAWLNSDESTVTAYGKYVKYNTTTNETEYVAERPTSQDNTSAKVAMPSYSAEAGFLTNFTDAQKAMIKTAKHKSLIPASGYKDSNIKGLGFTVNTDASSLYYNILEIYSNAGSGTYNTVPNVIVPGTAANDVYQGIHTGRGADNESSSYFWIDALTNINGVRGNNFNTEYFDSQAAYIEATDKVFVPSLFDVAEFGGKMLVQHKESNNDEFGYQCGSAKPTDVNYSGYIWTRDYSVASDSADNTNKFVIVHTPTFGPKAQGLTDTLGVQPAMYVSIDTADTFGIGSYEDPLVFKTDVSGADGSIDIAYNGTNVTATGYVYNTTATENKFTLIIAKYAVEGEEGEEELVIKEAVPASKTLGAAAGTDTLTASVGYEQGYVYKAFLWNGSSFAPYTAAKTLN